MVKMISENDPQRQEEAFDVITGTKFNAHTTREPLISAFTHKVQNLMRYISCAHLNQTGNSLQRCALPLATATGLHHIYKITKVVITGSGLHFKLLSSRLAKPMSALVMSHYLLLQESQR